VLQLVTITSTTSHVLCIWPTTFTWKMAIKPMYLCVTVSHNYKHYQSCVVHLANHVHLEDGN